MAQTIRKIGIVGAGQMGSGIAHVCSLAGMSVVLNDIAAPRLKDALATINGNMARQVTRKRITEEDKQTALKRISTAETFEGLVDCDLVIEAATEKEEVKRIAVIGAGFMGAGIASVSAQSGIDVILIDLQDLGCRIYTFITTLLYVLEAAARHRKAVWVLDRPNPAGRPIEGLKLRAGWESFVGAGPLPMRHGLTLGELGLWFVKTFRLDVDYQVVEMQGWQPDVAPGFGWPLGERIWINPSANQDIMLETSQEYFNMYAMVAGRSPGTLWEQTTRRETWSVAHAGRWAFGKTDIAFQKEDARKSNIEADNWIYRDRRQAKLGFQGHCSRCMALSVTSSLRMTAVSATLPGRRLSFTRRS